MLTVVKSRFLYLALSQRPAPPRHMCLCLSPALAPSCSPRIRALGFSQGLCCVSGARAGLQICCSRAGERMGLAGESLALGQLNPESCPAACNRPHFYFSSQLMCNSVSASDQFPKRKTLPLCKPSWELAAVQFKKNGDRERLSFHFPSTSQIAFFFKKRGRGLFSLLGMLISAFSFLCPGSSVHYISVKFGRVKYILLSVWGIERQKVQCWLPHRQNISIFFLRIGE